MKIKQVPDDFRVDEVTDFAATGGPFALYRLEKVGWTTHDAINTIRRLWQIPFERLSYGGLKDRHARTTQHLTIESGPARNLAEQGIVLTYLGQAPQPFTSDCIRANRFIIVVRDLGADQIAFAQRAIDDVRRDGLANYFDDQRFGSVSGGGEFIGQCMVEERWEEALKLALTTPSEFDRSAEKKQKAILRQHWGNWRECGRRLGVCHARTLVEYLTSRPSDFRGAIGRLRGDLAGLYLSAYQSHLWNAFLARWLTRCLPASCRVDVQLKLDRVPFPRGLSNEQSAMLEKLVLPLPSARLKYDELVPDAPPDWAEVLRETLDENGVALEQLRLKRLRRPFFSRGERAIVCRPRDLTFGSEADDRHPTRFKAALAFELPRGSYATLLVKRITVKTLPAA
jgi:tRNA pseudouridine13 synthase